MARKRMSYDSQLSLDMFSEVVEVIANPERQVAIELAKETFLVTPVAAAVAAVVEKHVPFVITDQLNTFGSKREKIQSNLKALRLVAKIRSGELRQEALNEEQKSDLVRYTGWGGLSAIFNPDGEYQTEFSELQSLLGQEATEAAKASMLTAYYTPVSVIRAMWKIVSIMGFTGGKVAEVAAGIGHFLGLMPLEMREVSHVTLVEPDPTSATIAKALYVSNKCKQTRVLNTGIEDAHVAPNSFDLAISNVPFGNFTVYDKRFKQLKAKIHDYFFAKGLDLVRPGGIVAFVTTSRTLDKAGDAVRGYLAERAELVTAIRLPSEAFEECAGTSVVTDILVFRKAAEVVREAEGGEDDLVETSANQRKGREFSKVAIDQMWHLSEQNYQVRYIPNEVFIQHRHLHLGRASANGRDQHGNTKWTVGLPANVTLEDALSEVVEKERDWLTGWYEPRAGHADDENMPAPGEYRRSSFFFDETTGGLHFIDASNQVEPQSHRPAGDLARLIGMTRLREVVQELIEVETMERDGGELRSRMNRIYDEFVKRHGNLLDAKNKRLFSADDSAPLLWSLEIYDEQRETYTKAPIFRTCTVSRATIASKAETLADALALSFNHHGRLHMAFLAECLDKPEAEVAEQLLDQELAFEDPVTGELVESAQYLSGNVRAKHLRARDRAVQEARFKRNEEALQPLVPTDISMEQISIQLGATWITAAEISQFAKDYFYEGAQANEEVCKVTFVEAMGNWIVEPNYRFVRSVRATTELGTSRRSFFDLLEIGLNQTSVTVQDEEMVDGKLRMVVNTEQTTAARDKADKIQQAFVGWVKAEGERRVVLERRYNDMFNSNVNRVYDGSHLVIPGLNPSIGLRAAQKDGIWRGIVDGNTLYAHEVGAGKTLVQICLAQELKRLGIANKPTLVVPNHMLEAFAGEYLRAFPRARVLAASKESLEGDKRRLLMMRIATGNWDAVIVTHSSFTRWSISEDFTRDFVGDVMSEISQGLWAAKMAGADSKTIREIERTKKSVKAKLKTLTDRSDKDTQVLPFDKIGVDYLIVDEADLFKNMWFFTKKTRVAGINNTASLRAFDMFLKSRVVFQRRGESSRGLVFATATPISNSVAEMYIMQKYLQEETLKEHGIAQFDSWAANYGRSVTSVEVAPDGSRYRMHTRFCKFDNLPELMSIFRQVADIKTEEMLNLPTPELAGGKHIVTAIPASEILLTYVASLVERVEEIRAGKVKPNEDNMLKVTSDGRKAALDLRCIDPDLPDLDESKVNACAANVYQHWLDGKDQRLTQLVFCDFSTPSNSSFSVYTDLKAKLIAKGIPAEEIAFAQDYTTDAQKAKLHRMVRVGKVRVLLGSTELMGFGTNVQDLLVAEHHLDAPWRPRDVKQRDGRIKRQGNRNQVIWIYRYVTERSFDAYQWQTLETKSKFIAQVMTGEGDLRSIEDVNGQSLSYAEVKAIASGNPMVIEKAGVDAEVARLYQLSRAHTDDQNRLRSRMRDANWHVDALTQKLVKAEADVAQMESLGKRIEVGRLTGEPSESIGQAIMQQKALAKLSNRMMPIFTSSGFVMMQSDNGHRFTGPSGNVYDIQNEYGKEAIAAWLPNLPALVQAEVDKWKASREAAKATIKALERQVGKPFEYLDQLKRAVERQAEIDESLGLNDSLTAAQETAEDVDTLEVEAA